MKNKQQTLSKTDYIQYLDCPEELWLRKNKPAALPPVDLDRQYKLDQGNLIDDFAQQWFSDGCVIEDWAINPKDVEFQLKAQSGDMLAITDIAVRQGDAKTIALFEVKAATSVKKEHYHDLAFQRMVFEDSGYKVTATYLVHVSKEYITSKEVDHCSLMAIKDITKEVEQLMEDTKATAPKVLEWINGKAPKKRITIGCSKKQKCPFVQMNYPELPKYSIFNIARISKAKIKKLVGGNIIDIQDVPADFPLSANQRQQVAIAQEDEIVLKRGSIRRSMKKLVYPLYYLDYESFSFVVPPQEGYKTYQQMVFQYSLHVQEKPGGKVKHHEYLLKSKTESVEHLIKDMQTKIGEKGSVIVWNKSFEKGRNTEMGNLFPAYRPFLDSVNERLYDLRVPFQKGHYQHPDFKGKTSLKSVLPVLAAEVSYDDLIIQNGMVATIKWHHATDGRMDEKTQAETFENLLKYCELDTLAMVKIMEVLQEV